jgi:hypothetical protein
LRIEGVVFAVYHGQVGVEVFDEVDEVGVVGGGAECSEHGLFN